MNHTKAKSRVFSHPPIVNIGALRSTRIALPFYTQADTFVFELPGQDIPGWPAGTAVVCLADSPHLTPGHVYVQIDTPREGEALKGRIGYADYRTAKGREHQVALFTFEGVQIEGLFSPNLRVVGYVHTRQHEAGTIYEYTDERRQFNKPGFLYDLHAHSFTPAPQWSPEDLDPGSQKAYDAWRDMMSHPIEWTDNTPDGQEDHWIHEWAGLPDSAAKLAAATGIPGGLVYFTPYKPQYAPALLMDVGEGGSHKSSLIVGIEPHAEGNLEDGALYAVYDTSRVYKHVYFGTAYHNGILRRQGTNEPIIMRPSPPSVIEPDSRTSAYFSRRLGSAICDHALPPAVPGETEMIGKVVALINDGSGYTEHPHAIYCPQGFTLNAEHTVTPRGPAIQAKPER